MKLVLDNGTEYETPGPGEPITVGMIVQLPDGRAAEVTHAAGEVNPAWPRTLAARAWDECDSRCYYTTDVYPYVEIRP